MVVVLRIDFIKSKCGSRVVSNFEEFDLGKGSGIGEVVRWFFFC